MWRSLTWFVHRCLCVVGVHANAKLFSVGELDLDADDAYTKMTEPKLVGVYCIVCNKHTEEDSSGND
jgi:hypothetical protein